jgi:NTP pyrophosphatase (non-canonical NTP hydrolase)
MSENLIEALQAELRHFAGQREWGEFHTAKNLVMALAGEVGELIALFQWLSPSEADVVMSIEEDAARVRDEMADVFGYLIRLADVLDVDLESALRQRIEINRTRYSVEKARGSAQKYDRLGD